MRDFQSNLKIVGGHDAIKGSWPATVLIEQSYRTDYTFPDGETLTVSIMFMCGGTLISHYTVLTAAHCIATEFDYDYNDETFNILIETNQYYPSFESMFEVSLGLYHIQSFKKRSIQTMSVGKIIKV